MSAGYRCRKRACSLYLVFGLPPAKRSLELSQNFSFYAQDTWKITPRLTMTYGLRWDINPPLKGKNLAHDPFTVVGLNDPPTMTLAPRGTPLHQTTYGNFAPRLGLAYQLNGRQDWGTLLRGGFGVFYDLGSGSLGGVSSYFRYLNDTFSTNVPFPLSLQQAGPPALTDSPPVNTILVAEPNLKLPRTYEWNVALEQSLGRTPYRPLVFRADEQPAQKTGACGVCETRKQSPNPAVPDPVFCAARCLENHAIARCRLHQRVPQRRRTVFSPNLNGSMAGRKIF